MDSAADSGRIVLQRVGKVAVILISHPEKKNAMTPEMSREFAQKLEEARIAEDIGAVVITGTGDAFCSGAHVGKVVSKVSGMTAAQWTASRGRGGGLGLYHMPKPTIAAINGACVALGFSIALDCDIRIAAREARFRVGFRRVGLIPSANICFLLPFLVGLGRAKLLIMADPIISGEEAYRIGLVEEVVPGEQLMTRALQLANELANGPLQMLMATKEAMNRAYGLDFNWLNIVRRNAEFVLTRTEDHKEAVSALTQKRQPKFTGR